MDKKITIAVGSEISAYYRKEEIKEHLLSQGFEVIDLGPKSEDDQVLYYEAGARMGRCIQNKEADKGVIVCGTGAGVSVVANKFKGVYCVACESVFTAEKIPIVNNANVLAMGANVVGKNNALEMVDAYVANTFCKDCDAARTEFLHGLFHHVTMIEDENFAEVVNGSEKA